MIDVLKEALAECATYARMGGLNDTMIRDIAKDHGITFRQLKKAYEDDDDK